MRYMPSKFISFSLYFSSSAIKFLFLLLTKIAITCANPFGFFSNLEGIKSIHAKTAKLHKKGVAFKSLDEETCEIKGSGHEMAAMMLMIIMHTAIIKIDY